MIGSTPSRKKKRHVKQYGKSWQTDYAAEKALSIPGLPTHPTVDFFVGLHAESPEDGILLLMQRRLGISAAIRAGLDIVESPQIWTQPRPMAYAAREPLSRALAGASIAKPSAGSILPLAFRSSAVVMLTASAGRPLVGAVGCGRFSLAGALACCGCGLTAPTRLFGALLLPSRALCRAALLLLLSGALRRTALLQRFGAAGRARPFLL